MRTRRGHKVMGEEQKNTKQNKKYDIIGIIISGIGFIIGFGLCYRMNETKELGNVNVIHVLYIFTCIVIAYIAMLIYLYKIMKLEKKYAFKEYKLNSCHKSGDSTQQASYENSQLEDNQEDGNKSVKQESHETEENAKNTETADTVAETAQVTEDVGKSNETQQSSQEDK